MAQAFNRPTQYLSGEGKRSHFFIIGWLLHDKTKAKLCSRLCRDKQYWKIPLVIWSSRSHPMKLEQNRRLLNSRFTVFSNFISPCRYPCFAIPSLFLFPGEWLLPVRLIHFIFFSDYTWHPLPYLRLGFPLILSSVWLSQNMFSMVLKMDLLLSRENKKVMTILLSSS